MGLFNMQPGQGMGQPNQPMPAPFDPMQGQQQPGLFNFSTPQMPAAQPRPSFFGEGGTGRAIAGNIGDALLQYGNMQPIYSKSQDELRKHAEAQREEAGKFAQFQREWDYKAANPAPEVDPVTRDANAYMNLDDPHRAAYNQMHPGQIVNMTLPNGQFYSGPAEGVAAALGGGQQGGGQAPPPGVTFTPMNSGGQTHPASGNFPR